MAATVEVKDNSKQVLNDTDVAVESALEIIGGLLERYAKQNCPVDTGLLRNSITYALDGQKPHIGSFRATYGENKNAKGQRYSANSKKAGSVKLGYYDGEMPAAPKGQRYVVVGSNVKYAPYIELGARGRKPHHMLKRAVNDHINEYRKIMENELKKVQE